MLLAKSVLSCHADPTHVACAVTARAWVLLGVVCPGQQRRGALSGPLPGEGAVPSSQLQAARQVWGRGNPSARQPLCATHPGRPWRFLEARHWGHTGPPVTPPEYGCGLGPRRHQETRQGATSVGSHMPRDRLLGARPCPSFLRPTLRLSGPHRATSTAHEAVSCCLGHESCTARS